MQSLYLFGRQCTLVLHHDDFSSAPGDWFIYHSNLLQNSGVKSIKVIIIHVSNINTLSKHHIDHLYRLVFVAKNERGKILSPSATIQRSRDSHVINRYLYIFSLLCNTYALCLFFVVYSI